MTARSFASPLPVDRARSLALVLLAATALAGCASSERFAGTTGTIGPSGSQRLDDTFRRENQGEPAPLPTRRPSAADEDVIPGGQTNEAVSAEEIPAEPPRAGDTRPSAIEPALGPQGVPPGTPGVGVTANAVAGAGAPAAASETQTAALSPRPEAPRQERPTAAAPRGDALSAVTGTWTVSDAGDRCRITLTSSPLFEFYRASPQNCRARTLSRINAWEQRGNEIVLMQPGGAIAARLSPDGSGYAGAMASGAPVTMTR